MAEFHHWTHFWCNTEEEGGRAKFPGLVTSSALSSFWHWQEPVIWMGALIACHKVPAPVSRVQWSEEQPECQKLSLLFLVLLSPRDLGMMALPGLIPPPQNSVNQECLVFSHSQSSLPKYPSGFWPPDALEWEMLLSRGAPRRRPLSLGAASANSSEGDEHLGIFCWVLNAEPPMYCKYVASLRKAVFFIAHVPKYALYSCTACDFNNSQSFFLVLCYWLNSKGSIYIKDQILKILGRTLGYLFWNLIEISVMLFTDEKPNRYILRLVMIALYCEMKPSREESKTLIFFQDAMCPCTKECFPISSLSHIRATVSFLSFEVPRREIWCFYCLPISQTFEMLFKAHRDRS